MVGCIYKHPPVNVDIFKDKLDEVIKHFNLNKYQLYLLGDMNIDFFKCNSHQPTDDYLNMLYSNNLLPVITKPTRLTHHSATLIDHIYTNTTSQIISGIITVDLSDHFPVICITDIPVKRHNTVRYYRDYSKYNEDSYLQDISTVNWNAIYSERNDLHDITAKTIDLLKSIANKHAPIRQMSQKKQKLAAKPWITKGIFKSIKTKHAMYKTHFFSNNPAKVAEYKKYANKLNWLKNTSKKSYFCQHFDLCKNNLRASWRLIGMLIKRNSKGQTPIPKVIRNNRVYTDKAKIADIFNKHFVNVGPNLAKEIENCEGSPTQFIKTTPSASFVMSAVTETQVSSLFKGLSDNKTSLDIPNKLIKAAALPLSKPLTYIYNLSIETGIVPDVLKISQVTPVFKSGDATNPSNYRPIATLSPFSKVLERLIYDQLYAFVEKHHILYNYQFGFRKGYSTEQAILEITDNLKLAIDKRQVTCGLFLDLSKAFDTVNHRILLSKLYLYGIRGVPHRWFESYLHNRKQYVKIESTKSDNENITCGIPQGSTLGPLLFLLYVNDLPNCTDKLSVRSFADDTNFFFSSDNLQYLESVMNHEIKLIYKYCALNRLSINFSKTNYMLVSSPRYHPRINIDNVEEKDHIKYLGVYIDKHLNWQPQLQHINNKVAKNTGILTKLRHYLNLHMLKQIYYALIYPYLSYGIFAWGCTSNNRLKLPSYQAE